MSLLVVKMEIFKTIDFKLDLPVAKYLRQTRVDVSILIGLAIAIAISTYLGTTAIPEPIFTDFYAQDVWFGSDIPTVFGNITSLNSDFGRNNKHPLFPLIVFPLVFTVGKLFHLDALLAVRVVVVGVAALWICSMYVLFRLMGGDRLEATLFSLLGGVSAAAVFWLVTPESFPLGSVTIIWGLAVVAFAQTHPLTPSWYVAVNIITVSITITNWMVGLFATLVSHRWQQALKIVVTALLLATGLWILQRIVFTNAGFPFQPGTFIGEKKFVSTPAAGGILAVMSAFFYQTMVMPATQFSPSPIRPDWVKLDVQHLAPASGSWWGTMAIVSWTALLGLGVWGFLTTKQQPRLRIVLGLTLLAQLVMHSIYGVAETFIYSLHFLPLLLTLAAFGLFTRLRPLIPILVTILIVSAGINNRSQLRTISAELNNYGSARQQVAAQIKLRPTDPWPRRDGRVVLATPGSNAQQRAFHSPGGSFSPQPGSFGVSIWAIDRQGNLITTSDRIPLAEIQQQFTDLSPDRVPQISTKTKYYQTVWSMPTAGAWQLNLRSLANGDRRIVVAIRSVGPAGGAISSLDWNGNRLLISDRWSVKNIPQQAKVYLGSENTAGWSRDRSDRTRWVDPNGWGYARIELNPGESGSFRFEDPQPTPAPTLQSGETIDLALNLPDSQFVASLKAQIAHLQMGLVGTRTHPSDPIGYPLPRFRDGAYQLVALARAGQLGIAQQLSPYFAENDFINSTLPAADIPAIGIWALTEVAKAIDQPAYDRSIWPQIERKAELIGNMLSSNRSGYPVFAAAKFPFAEQPDLVRVDLLAGKMTATPNAISIDPAAGAICYRALLDAATLADRLQQTDRAQQWRSQAAQLKTGWQTANQTEFTVTDGLWPSGIADSQRAAMAQTLQQRWEKSRDDAGAFRATAQPLHANIAEAHQWVLLDRADRLWPKLKWFWQQQASPGLYTWSGDRDESGEIPQPQSFSQWERLRVTTDPAALTPHYWTAAEMLLLQLDLLAYIDRTTSSPVLTIGAGMPSAWLSQPLSVTGRLVEGNLVNWAWDGQQLNVQIRGETMQVKISSVFPPGTPVKVEMLPKKLPRSTSSSWRSLTVRSDESRS
jgi:hypothetical protein